jgi:ATP-dependent RNA helicase DBP3
VKKGADASQQQQHQKRPLALVGDAALAASSPAIVRELYQEHPEVAAMSSSEVAALRAERCTTVDGADIKPLRSFEHTGLPSNMLHSTRDFVAPSPIQSQCWPVALSGHDLIGIAATGSGKTLGFGLPMMRHISAQKEAGVVRGKGPFAMVMAPTRELAIQIAEVLVDAGSRCGISCVCVYGGVPKGPQVQALKGGVDVVVGTPGRLEDLMGDGVCKLQVSGGCGGGGASMKPAPKKGTAAVHCAWPCFALVSRI